MRFKPFLTAATFAALMLFAPGAQAASGYVVHLVNLRAGPDMAYPVVAQIPANAALDVQGCVNGWSWCDVSWGNYRGWVSGQFLQMPYEDHRAYISEAGPAESVPVVEFNFGNYWDHYYRGRPFYADRAHYEHFHGHDWRHGNSGHDWHHDHH